MIGRITSQDPSRNAYGVLWREIHERHVAIAAEQEKALTEALEAWAAWDEAEKARPANPKGRRALLRKARRLTESALS